MQKKKKKYLRPRIVYEKKIETLAAVCDSTWIGPGGNCCQKGTCLKRSA
ncbi:MAG: hypothetical protein MJA29_00220 [Candidatus Omnitrophica bacterium]|nr:hypothetical protein [Candidatus Omnitrophota bacterium]